MTQLFNIASIAIAATGVLHLKNAAGELLYADAEKKMPIRIHLHSPGSEAFAAVENRQSARAVKRIQDNDGKVTVAPHEQRLADTAEDLAALTIKFENFRYEPAGDSFGPDLFRAVYGDPKLGFITKQVTKHLGDWSHFTGSSELI